jgi:hypothetical protein
MKKQRNKNRKSKPKIDQVRENGIRRATILVLAFAIVAILSYWFWNPKRTDPPKRAIRRTDVVESNSITSASPTTKPDFQKLVGTWQRPDGGYIIAINSVDTTGKMDAAYFNPMPIGVSKAEASVEGQAMTVFIELQAPNYPGSTYTLEYEPASDQFRGIYYQALQKQSFEVAFERMK